MKKSGLAAIIACSLLLTASSLHATAPFTFGFGPKSIAMGGAAAGLADDISAAYYNPAGMTQCREVNIGVGFQYMKPWMKLNDRDFPIDTGEAFVLGAALPLPFGGFLKNRIFAGIAFYMPWNLILGLKVPLPSEPQYLLLENEPRVTTIMPALAIEITSALSVGASVNLYDDTYGAFDATLTSENEPVLEVNQELTTTFSPTVGVHIRPGQVIAALENLTLGFVYRSAFRAKYRFSPDIFIGTVPLLIDLAATSLYNPRQVVIGGAYRFGDRTTVTLDLSFNEWSKMPDPNLEAKFDFRIPVIPVHFSESIVYPPNFHDTFTPKVGIDFLVGRYERIDVKARAGYWYEESPIPEQRGVTSYLDTDRHILSTGLGITVKRLFDHPLPNPIGLDVYIQYQHMVERTHHKSPEVAMAYPDYDPVKGGGDILTAGVFISSKIELTH
ncbi:OmpP1/FadL family transporter [Thermodesulfobacteriota bacterium]